MPETLFRRTSYKSLVSRFLISRCSKYINFIFVFKTKWDVKSAVYSTRCRNLQWFHDQFNRMTLSQFLFLLSLERVGDDICWYEIHSETIQLRSSLKMGKKIFFKYYLTKVRSIFIIWLLQDVQILHYKRSGSAHFCNLFHIYRMISSCLILTSAMSVEIDACMQIVSVIEFDINSKYIFLSII